MGGCGAVMGQEEFWGECGTTVGVSVRRLWDCFGAEVGLMVGLGLLSRHVVDMSTALGQGIIWGVVQSGCGARMWLWGCCGVECGVVGWYEAAVGQGEGSSLAVGLLWGRIRLMGPFWGRVCHCGGVREGVVDAGCMWCREWV